MALSDLKWNGLLVRSNAEALASAIQTLLQGNRFAMTTQSTSTTLMPTLKTNLTLVGQVEITGSSQSTKQQMISFSVGESSTDMVFITVRRGKKAEDTPTYIWLTPNSLKVKVIRSCWTDCIIIVLQDQLKS